jgi:hypothetical protein
MTDELKAVFTEALAKHEKGAEKYGAFNPATDQRDFLKESEAEILDGINYLAMFLLKLRQGNDIKEEFTKCCGGKKGCTCRDKQTKS